MKDVSIARIPVDAAARSPRPAPVGPDWFESSCDLRCGLEVTEEGRADAALCAGIDSFLGAPTAQPRAARVASPRAITAIA